MTPSNTMMTQRPRLTSLWLRVLGIVTVAYLLIGCDAAMPVALEEPIEVRVEGRVTDAATGAPLDSVVVVMWSGILVVDEVTHASITTEEDGLYSISERFDDECPGDLRLRVSHRSFRYERKGFDLECVDGTRRVNVTLVRSEDGTTGATDPSASTTPPTRPRPRPLP